MYYIYFLFSWITLPTALFFLIFKKKKKKKTQVETKLNKKLFWWKNKQLVHFGAKFNFYFLLDHYTVIQYNPTNKKQTIALLINYTN